MSLFRSFTKFQLPVLASITAIGPFAIDAYLPAFPAIAESLNVDPVLVTQTISAYFIGLSAGGLLAGPLSDQIGRRPIALAGLLVFGIVSLLIPLVNTLEQMLVMRFVQALGGGFSTAVVVPTIRDVSPANLFASRAALVFTLLLIAPIIAPIAGALLLAFNWHWIFIVLGFYALLVLVIYAVGIPESVENRTRKFEAGPVLSAYWRVAKHRVGGDLQPLRYGVAYSFSFSILFIYLTNSSFVFQTYYGASPESFTLFFALIVGLIAIVQVSSGRYLRRISLFEMAKFMRIGFFAQLVALAATVVLLLAGKPPLWLFLIFVMVSLSLLGIIVPSSIGVYMSAFRASSGAASAISTTLSFLLGAGLGSLSGLLNNGGLLACFGIMLAASVIANAILFSIGTHSERVALEALQNDSELTI